MGRKIDDEWRRGRRNVAYSHIAAAVARRWPSEDAHPLARAEVKRQGTKWHWKVGQPTQDVVDRPWNNGSVQDMEEGLPSVREEGWQRGVTKAPGVGPEGLHLQVLSDWTEELCEEVFVFLAKMGLTISKHVTSEKPIAVLLTLIRRWKLRKWNLEIVFIWAKWCWTVVIRRALVFQPLLSTQVLTWETLLRCWRRRNEVEEPSGSKEFTRWKTTKVCDEKCTKHVAVCLAWQM